MFFVLSKTLGIMLLPTNFLIGVGLLGAMLLATRWASLGRKLMVASIVLLAICGFSPLGNWLLYPLEQRFPPWDAARGAPDGIVVLGGSIDADLSAAHGGAVVTHAADRIIAAAALARRYPNARIVFSGGSANLISDDAAGSRLRRALFESLGISKERLTMERRSRNTQENAEFSKAMVDAEKRRAMAAGDLGLSYAALGRPVSQGGICRRAVSGGLAGRRALRTSWRFRPSPSRGWDAPTSRMREWIGLVAYWVTGKIDRIVSGAEPKLEPTVATAAQSG